MHSARFLCGLPFSFNSACVQLLGSKELPSLSEVFSRLRQASPSSAASVYATRDRLALVFFYWGHCRMHGWLGGAALGLVWHSLQGFSRACVGLENAWTTAMGSQCRHWSSDLCVGRQWAGIVACMRRLERMMSWGCLWACWAFLCKSFSCMHGHRECLDNGHEQPHDIGRSIDEWVDNVRWEGMSWGLPRGLLGILCKAFSCMHQPRECLDNNHGQLHTHTHAWVDNGQLGCVANLAQVFSGMFKRANGLLKCGRCHHVRKLCGTTLGILALGLTMPNWDALSWSSTCACWHVQACKWASQTWLVSSPCVCKWASQTWPMSSPCQEIMWNNFGHASACLSSAYANVTGWQCHGLVRNMPCWSLVVLVHYNFLTMALDCSWPLHNALSRLVPRILRCVAKASMCACGHA
ncbi:hypothetical protein Acr_14g0001090 [Actinidia rufa]|uniref:Uncharacterized protein n=1 Tax=Actinidia rufa TaxID=165716 RepID=A0A7J0FPH6_9ERIC|nr:hypothetical protein Acr_14g0001090 [Actinidia rufa]